MKQGPNVLNTIGVRTTFESCSGFTHQGSELLRKKGANTGDITRCFGFDLRVQKRFSGYIQASKHNKQCLSQSVLAFRLHNFEQ
jgi:hypothetical protein